MDSQASGSSRLPVAFSFKGSEPSEGMRARVHACANTNTHTLNLKREINILYVFSFTNITGVMHS